MCGVRFERFRFEDHLVGCGLLTFDRCSCPGDLRLDDDSPPSDSLQGLEGVRADPLIRAGERGSDSDLRDYLVSGAE